MTDEQLAIELFKKNLTAEQIAIYENFMKNYDGVTWINLARNEVIGNNDLRKSSFRFNDVYKSNKVMYTGLHPAYLVQEAIDTWLSEGLTRDQIFTKLEESFDNTVKGRKRNKVK